jgi:hypothetical protein
MLGTSEQDFSLGLKIMQKAYPGASFGTTVLRARREPWSEHGEVMDVCPYRSSSSPPSILISWGRQCQGAAAALDFLWVAVYPDILRNEGDD